MSETVGALCQIHTKRRGTIIFDEMKTEKYYIRFGNAHFGVSSRCPTLLSQSRPVTFKRHCQVVKT